MGTELSINQPLAPETPERVCAHQLSESPPADLYTSKKTDTALIIDSPETLSEFTYTCKRGIYSLPMRGRPRNSIRLVTLSLQVSGIKFGIG